MPLMGGVSMKALSISVILLMLGANPVNAGLMTSEEQDQAARCGLTAARLIGNMTEGAVIFPEDLSICRDVESETNDQSKIDPSRHDAVSGWTRDESPEIAVLFLNASF